MARSSSMSSSQEMDQSEGQSRRSAGFVKSVIKVLSGSRFMTPEGLEKDSPTPERHDARMADRELNDGQNSDELSRQESDLRESLEQKRYYDEFRALPMNELTKELRYMDVPSSISAGFKENKNSLGLFLSQEHRLLGDANLAERQSKPVGYRPVESPSLSHGEEREENEGQGINLETERQDTLSRQHSQPFSSLSSFQPTRTHHSVKATEPESHPYFRPLPTADESFSLRVGHQNVQNITQRDAKRPKERSKDKLYKQ